MGIEGMVPDANSITQTRLRCRVAHNAGSARRSPVGSTTTSMAARPMPPPAPSTSTHSPRAICPPGKREEQSAVTLDEGGRLGRVDGVRHRHQRKDRGHYLGGRVNVRRSVVRREARGGSGAQGAQAADDAGKRLDEGLDVAIGGRPPDRQAQGPFAVHAHGLEHG
jgi:hypothetical protein